MSSLREQVFARVMKRGLLLHPDQSTGPVSSWKERDKLSTAFLLSLPGPHYGIPSPVFSKAIATLLCAPSPMCSARLGQPIRRSRVDMLGHNVINVDWRVLTGFTDMILSRLKSMLSALTLVYQRNCEAYGFFFPFNPTTASQQTGKVQRKTNPEAGFYLSAP